MRYARADGVVENVTFNYLIELNVDYPNNNYYYYFLNLLNVIFVQTLLTSVTARAISTYITLWLDDQLRLLALLLLLSVMNYWRRIEHMYDCWLPIMQNTIAKMRFNLSKRNNFRFFLFRYSFIFSAFAAESVNRRHTH